MNLQFIVPLLYPAAILAFVLALRKPEFGVYYLTLVLPLQTLRYQLFDYPFGGSIVDIVLLGILIGVVVNGRAAEFSTFPVRGILLLFTLYSYLSLWYGSFLFGFGAPTSAADPRFSLWRNWAEFGVLCAVSFAAIKTRKQVETVVLLMCVTAFALSWDFFQVMSFRDVSHYSYDLRYSGVMGYANANGLAAFEAMFLLFLLGMFSLKMPTWLKAVILPTMVACGYGLLFTFSRGAYLGLAVGVIALGILRKKFYVVVLMAIVIASSALLPTAVTDRIAGTYTQGATSTEATFDTSAMDRVIIWQSAVTLAVAHPIVGMGFNTYEFLHPYGLTDTHNLYLKILVEEGIVGLLFFLAMMWKMFRQGYALFRESLEPWMSSLGLGFAISVLGTMVINFFGDRWSYLQVDSYLWISLALVCRARLLAHAPAIETAAQTAVPLEPSSLQPAH